MLLALEQHLAMSSRPCFQVVCRPSRSKDSSSRLLLGETLIKLQSISVQALLLLELPDQVVNCVNWIWFDYF